MPDACRAAPARCCRPQIPDVLPRDDAPACRIDDADERLSGRGRSAPRSRKDCRPYRRSRVSRFGQAPFEGERGLSLRDDRLPTSQLMPLAERPRAATPGWSPPAPWRNVSLHKATCLVIAGLLRWPSQPPADLERRAIVADKLVVRIRFPHCLALINDELEGHLFHHRQNIAAALLSVVAITTTNSRLSPATATKPRCDIGIVLRR